MSTTVAFRRLRHALARGAVSALIGAVRRFPRPAVMAAGRAMGFAAYAISRRQRRIAHANLDIVFPAAAMARGQKRRVARGAFRSFGATALGLLWAPNLTADNVDRWACLCPRGAALLRRTRERGRGFVLAVPHYGDWELLSLAMGFWGYPYMAVGADTANRAVGGVLHRLRTRSGHVLVPPRYALLKLLRHLKRGGSAAMILDANVPRLGGGLWLDFFGLPVFNTYAPVELALRCDAAVLFGYVRGLPDGRSELVLEEIDPARTGDRAADVRATSQRLLDRAAALIRADPGPWLWPYRRWRRRPTPERGAFPFYSRHDDPLARWPGTAPAPAAASAPPEDDAPRDPSPHPAGEPRRPRGRPEPREARRR